MPVEAQSPEPVETPTSAAANDSPRQRAIENLNAKIAARADAQAEPAAEAAEAAEPAVDEPEPSEAEAREEQGEATEPGAPEPAEASDGEDGDEGQADDGEQKRPSKEERRRNYQAAMARRRARQAKERERKAQELEQRLAEREKQIEQRLSQIEQFEQRFQQDPYGAAAQRLGVSREQAVAMYADGQADQIPAAVQHRLDQYEAKLREMQEREQRQQQEREQRQKQATFRQAVERDVAALSGRVEEKTAAEDWPAYASLPEQWRQRMAREAVHFWLREDPDVHPDMIMDYLDEQAQPLVQSVRGNGRAADKKEATGQGQGTRASTRKPRGASSARATAAPARRSGASSPEELRQRAIEKLNRRFAERSGS